MTPKSSAKKRKAPETNQPILDSSTTIQSARSKLITPQNTSSSLPSAPLNRSTENGYPNTPMKADRKNGVTLLGRCRRNPGRDSIKIHHFEETRPKFPSDEQFDDTWAILGELMDAILERKLVTNNFQVAYELCQSVCLYGKERVLYSLLESTVAKHIQRNKDVIIRELDENTFLATINCIWKTFCNHLGTMGNIFMELERRYILPNTVYISISDLGKKMFRKSIMESNQIQQKTIEGVTDLIQRDRNDRMFDLKTVCSITQMLLDLSLYTSLFEPYFMEATTDYYSAESTNKLQELSIQNYLHYAHHRIEQESEKRINTYLDESTKPRLTKLAVKLFILDKLDIILSQGFKDLMDQEDTATLKILYYFLPLDQTQLVAKLRVAFADYIKNHGIELIKDPRQDRTMISTLLQYKAKSDQILESAFGNNPSFANALKESFETFINSRNTKPAEMLTKFIDNKLRSGSKKHPQQQQDEDLEEVLNKVLVIFRFIQGKDVFEALYKRLLSKRLLLSRSVSNDMEKSLLSKIKSECGPEFTRNLENMLKDMETSVDLNVTFKEYTDQEKIPMFVNVLAQSVWPTSPAADIILPANMANLLDAYQIFYTNIFNGRKLTWRHALATCILKAHFPVAKKELSVSLFQAIILMLFNDKSKSMIGYKDIATATELDDKELNRVLQSLSCGKHIILNKHPQSNNIADDDTFQYNDQFTASTYRLKINVIQQEQQVEEQREIQTKVLVDRQYQLEAAIVRIMKSEKRMSHKDLTSKLFLQLKFPIDDRDIKDRIEWLIERDYLIRDETNNSVYLYQS